MSLMDLEAGTPPIVGVTTMERIISLIDLEAGTPPIVGVTTVERIMSLMDLEAGTPPGVGVTAKRCLCEAENIILFRHIYLYQYGSNHSIFLQCRGQVFRVKIALNQLHAVVNPAMLLRVVFPQMVVRVNFGYHKTFRLLLLYPLKFSH